MDYPRKEWLLCFDFDGTLIDPKKSQEIDPSLQKALSLIRENPNIKLIKLSRRFGQPSAMLAGIKKILIITSKGLVSEQIAEFSNIDKNLKIN